LLLDKLLLAKKSLELYSKPPF